MKEKSTPIGTKIFASLSVLNILATIVCILSVFALRDNVIGQGMWINIFINPAAQVFTSLVFKAISGLAWLFVIANTLISIAMMLVAMMINRSKQVVYRNAILPS